MTAGAEPVPEQLEALDAWLAAREARHDDLREETDERIVWAAGERRRTPLSIVYLHGFSASRRETAPLCDRMAEALGANLFYARLAGHGRSPEAMGEATVADWLDDAQRAWSLGTRLGQRVAFVGTSTGGTLATLFASRCADPRLAALMLIA
ncbi:MAG: alpha/beta fold hydrolase, partial [Pseudomonadales bacterium]|nr:alpha/beta fold hydrolase [Pseudomonadales bacterium]